MAIMNYDETDDNDDDEEVPNVIQRPSRLRLVCETNDRNVYAQ